MTKKCATALRENLRSQLVIIVCSLIGLVYILATTERRSFGAIKSLVIALGHTYGLILAIFFLGIGLVNVPRRIWTFADSVNEIRDIQKRAVGAWEQFQDSKEELRSVVQEVKELNANINRVPQDLRNWVSELHMKTALFADDEADNMNLASENHSRQQTNINKIDAKAITNLARKLKRYSRKYERYQKQWELILKRYTFLQDIVGSVSGNEGLEIQFRNPPLLARHFPKAVCYIWYVFMRKYVWYSAAVLFGVVSVMIFWSEMVNSFQTPLLSVIGIITRLLGWNGGIEEIFNSFILCYMAVCTYSSLMRVKVFNKYAMTIRSTDPVSLLFFSSYLCRLTVPLSYNFVTLLDRKTDSVFSRFLGASINLTDLGKGFNAWFPLFILVPVFVTAFNVMERIKYWFGFDAGTLFFEDGGDEDGTGSHSDAVAVTEGRALLSQAIAGEDLTYRSSLPVAIRWSSERNRTIEGANNITGLGIDDRPSLDEEDREDTQFGFGRRVWNTLSTRIDSLKSSTDNPWSRMNSRNHSNVNNNNSSNSNGRRSIAAKMPRWLQQSRG